MKNTAFAGLFLCMALFCQGEELVIKQLTPTQRIVVREDKTVWQILVQLDTQNSQWIDEVMAVL